MEIDETLEAQVRDAFSAVIGQDADQLAAVLADVPAAQGPTAVAYAVYVCGFVVLDVTQGQADAEGLSELAADVVSGTREWIDIGSADQVTEFLSAAQTGDLAFPGLPAEDVGGHAFVVGGYLLSRYRHEGQRWYQYLDDAWAAASR